MHDPAGAQGSGARDQHPKTLSAVLLDYQSLPVTFGLPNRRPRKGSRRLIPAPAGRQVTCRVASQGAAGTKEPSGLTWGSAPLCGTQSHQEGGERSKKEAVTPAPQEGVCSSIFMELRDPSLPRSYSRPPRGSRPPGRGAGP